MTGTAELVHGCLALATALWASYSLTALRDARLGRPLWVGMVALGVGEAIHTLTVYQWISERVGPGWTAVLYHSTGLIAAIATVQLVHGLLGQSQRARLTSLSLGGLALIVGAFPLVVMPSHHLPAGAPRFPVMYGGNWNLALHWAAFLAYLSYALIFAAWTCARQARKEPPGRLRTSMALIGAGCAEGMLYVVGHSCIEVATWFPGGLSLTRVDAPMDAVTLGASIALISIGASWEYVAEFGQGIRQRADLWAMRRHIMVIQPAWAALERNIPGLSLSSEDIARLPVGTWRLLFGPRRSIERFHDDLSWQQTRLVAEIYGAMRLVLPHVNEEDRALIAKKVAERGLDGVTAHTAATAITLRLGMIAKRGETIRPPREPGDLDVQAATAAEAAAQVARSIGRTRSRRVQRVITEILHEETFNP